MIGFLARRFIQDYQNTADAAVRRAYGMLCGAVGIAINLLLFALKLLAGTLAGSVAITADAFNNLSDAGASIVTLLGFRLAGQKPDTEHPFGHGRIEYISGLIVSLVILLMGFELLRDAVGAILHPEAVECSALTVTILLVSICAKFYMYCYNRGVGKKLNAAAMQATAADSLSDCAATAAVLLSTLAGHFLHWQIDGWCGLVVSLLILWAGFQAAKDTLSPLLGQPPTEEFVQEIRDIVMANKAVCGIHDLVVHDYGPGRVMISLHAEVPAHGDILTLHDEIDIDPQTEDCLLPKLVLQPLVENAIYHGIKVKQQGGTVRIESLLEEDRLLITVEDDGVGMTPEQLATILEKKEADGESSKIGVCNVNERLQLFFGSEAAMKYYSEPGKRTMVMLVLPIVREKGDADAEA